MLFSLAFPDSSQRAQQREAAAGSKAHLLAQGAQLRRGGIAVARLRLRVAVDGGGGGARELQGGAGRR
jgi:hypothetical protein